MTLNRNHETDTSGTLSANGTARSRAFPSGVNLPANLIKALVLLAALALIVLTRGTSYLLFHSIAELFSIVVAFGVFIVAWNSAAFVQNSYLLLLGIGTLFAGGIDLLHTLSFKGMGIFPGNSANLPTQLWLAARYLQAGVWLVAPLFLKRTLKKYPALILLGALTSGLLASIFVWPIFPAAYVDGAGLTSFKIASEYVIVAMLIGATGLLWRNRSEFDRAVLWWLIGSAVATIAAELAFTLYFGVTDTANLVGHLFKIIAFYLLYRALVETGFTRPYNLIFRQITHHEQLLEERVRERTADLQRLYNAAPAGYHSVNERGLYLMVNQTELDWLGCTREELIGVRRFRDFFTPDSRQRFEENFPRYQAQGYIKDLEIELVRKDGSIFPVLLNSTAVRDEAGHSLHSSATIIDITDLKQATVALARSEEFKQAIFNSLEEHVAVIDQAGKIIAVNDPWRQFALDNGITDPEPSVIQVNYLNVLRRSQAAGDENAGEALWGIQAVLAGSRSTYQLDYPCDGPVRSYWFTMKVTRLAQGQGAVIVHADITDRKQAAEVLQESEERFRAISEAAGDFIFTVTLDGRIDYMNERAARLMGYTSQTIAGQHLRDLFHPESFERQWANLQTVLSTGAPLYTEALNRTAQGELWLGTWLVPLRDAAGHVFAALGDARDISERKQVERALTASEERYRQLSDDAPLAAVVIDLETRRVQYANRLAADLFRLPIREALGRSAVDFYADLADRERFVQRLLEQGAVTDYEIRLKRDDGSVFWASITSRITMFQNRPAIHSVYLDITARKQVEAALRENELKLSEAATIAGLGYWEHDIVNDRVILNDRLYAMFHTTAEQMGGYAFSTADYVRRFIYPEDAARVPREIQQALEDPATSSAQLEHRILCGDGDVITIGIRTLIVRDEQGRPIRAFGVDQDITDRKRAEERLQESEAKFSAAFNLSPLYLQIATLDGKIVEVNQTFSDLIGLSREEMIGKDHAELGSRFVLDDEIIGAQIAQSGGVVRNLEARFHVRDGSQHAVLFSTNPITLHGRPHLLFAGVDITARNQAEAARREIEEQFKAFFENAVDAILVTELDGRILAANPAACHMFDMTEQDFIAGGRAAVVDMTDPRVEPLLKERLEKGKAHGEVTNLRRDGTKFPGEITSAIYIGKDGGLKTSLIIRDITERKLADEALRASEEKFRAIIETSPDAIGLFDFNGNILMMNPAAAVTFGYATRADMIGKNALGFFLPDDQPKAADMIQQVLTSGAVQNIEFRLLRHDGTWFSAEFSCSALYEADGSPKGIIAITRDITERKQAEAALRDSHEIAHTIINSATDGIFLIEINGQVLAANETVAARLGRSVTDLIGTNIYDHLPAEMAAARKDYVAQAVRDHQPVFFEDERLGFWQENSIYPATDSDGQVRRVAVYWRDITERKHLAQALAAERDLLEQRVIDRTRELTVANERLRELDQLKSKFVSDVTHELRTPVTSLSLYIDLLEHGKPERREQYVSRLKDQMTRLHKLINDILDMARLERAPDEGGRMPVDLNVIVEHISVMEQAAAESAGLTLQCETAANLPPVIARPDQLTRAITNLIANAFKYTPAGSVHVRTYQQGQRVCIQVTDTGRGIPADELPHLFSRFYRGREVAQSKIPGTGLGLSIVKEIIEAHGGTVDVESQSGVGSTFRVWLPAADNLPMNRSSSADDAA